MAYAFSKIDEAVGAEPEKQDIFGGGMQEESGGQGAPLPMGSEMVKTTTEGEIGTTHIGAPESVKHTKDPGSSAKAMALQANVGKTAAPEGLSDLRGRIDRNQALLQNRANEYTQQYQQQASQKYDVTRPTLERAVSQGGEDFQRIQGIMGRGMADMPDQFTGAEGLGVKGVDDLSTSAGLMRLASQGKGPRYTKGMSAFDVMLMQRDPTFLDTVSDIRIDERALERERGSLPGQLEAQAQQYGQERFEAGREKARDFLTERESQLKAQNQAEADAYNDMLRNLDVGTLGGEESERIRKQVEGDLTQEYGSRIAPQLEQAQANIADYLTVDQPDYGYRQFVDQTEADQFNRIMGMLGEGGQAYGAAGALRPQYSVDEGGYYENIAGQARDLRAQRDIDQRSLMDQILGGAQTRADIEDARVAELRGSYEPRLAQIGEQVLQENPFLREFYDPAMASQYQDITVDPLYARDLGAYDVLTPEEAQSLNEISADLGLTQAYGAGGAEMGGGFLDEANYRQYLLDRLNPMLEQARRDYQMDTERRAAEAQAGGAVDLSVPDAPGGTLDSELLAGMMPTLSPDPNLQWEGL